VGIVSISDSDLGCLHKSAKAGALALAHASGSFPRLRPLLQKRAYLIQFRSYLFQLGKRGTKKGSYLFAFLLYRTEKGSYLTKKGKRGTQLGSHLIRLGKRRTKEGSYLIRLGSLCKASAPSGTKLQKDETKVQKHRSKIDKHRTTSETERAGAATPPFAHDHLRVIRHSRESLRVANVRNQSCASTPYA